MRPMTLKMRGFTLIELMIVVAIISILAGIAIPQYNQYVIRSKLTDGQSVFADYRTRLEQFYQDNRNYGTAGSQCGDADADGNVNEGGDAALPTSKYFGFACTVDAGGQGYNATATSTANSGLGSAGDYTYTLDEANARATTKFAGAVVAKTCWITSAGQSC